MTTQRKLNTQEAADYLGIRPNTLEVWRCKHRGPKYSKIGSRVLYAMEDLESFFNAKAVYTRYVSRNTGNALRQEG
mgnify:CR=1 FL=1